MSHITHPHHNPTMSLPPCRHSPAHCLSPAHCPPPRLLLPITCHPSPIDHHPYPLQTPTSYYCPMPCHHPSSVACHPPHQRPHQYELQHGGMAASQPAPPTPKSAA